MPRKGTHETEAILLALAAATLAASASAQDLPEIQARGTLRVLAVTSAEETFFVADSPRGGFDWEMLEGFAKLHKLDARSWSRWTAGTSSSPRC